MERVIASVRSGSSVIAEDVPAWISVVAPKADRLGRWSGYLVLKTPIDLTNVDECALATADGRTGRLVFTRYFAAESRADFAGVGMFR